MPDGLSDIIIADRLTDANQTRVPNTGNLAVSWELSRPGALSCDVPLPDLVATGLQPENLLAKWVHYTHPTAGAWGGQITNVLATDGIVSLTAESWLSCLRGVTPGNATPSSVAGAVGFIIDVNAALTGITRTSSSIQSTGVIWPSEVADDFAEENDLLDTILPAILGYWTYFISRRAPEQFLPMGFNVDPTTRVFSLNPAFGTDRSATVALRDGLTNVGGTGWSDDLLDVFNTVYVTAMVNWRKETEYCAKYRKNRRGKKKCVKKKTRVDTGSDETTMKGVNHASRARYGVRTYRETRDEPGWEDASLLSYATDLANALSRNQQMVTVNCTDEDGLWADFREGDAVAVTLGNSGATGKMVVRHRAVNMATGVMTVTGEAEVS